MIKVTAIDNKEFNFNMKNFDAEKKLVRKWKDNEVSMNQVLNLGKLGKIQVSLIENIEFHDSTYINPKICRDDFSTDEFLKYLGEQLQGK